MVNNSEVSEMESIVEAAPRTVSRTYTPEMSNATRSTLSPYLSTGSKRMFTISFATFTLLNVS